nr:spindle pole body-associated protein sad1 [Quercus suber]
MADPRRRATRSHSATPAVLPAVQSKQSHAYGAKGKTTLQTQLTTDETSLEHVMDETSAVTTATPSRMTRNSTGNRQTPDRSMRPPGPRSVRQNPPPTIEEESETKTPQQSRHVQDSPGSPTMTTKTTRAALHAPTVVLTNPTSSELTPAEQADRDRTLLSEQRFYAQELAKQRAREQQQLKRHQHDPGSSAWQNEEILAQAQPSSWKVFVSALPRYIPLLLRDANGGKWTELGYMIASVILGFLTFVFMATVGVCIIYGAASLLPWPAAWQPLAGNFVNAGRSLAGLSLYDKAPTELEERWIRFQHDILFEPMLPKDVLPDQQYQVNLLLAFRMERLEKRMAAAEDTLGLHNETLRLLNDALPSYVVVEEVNGETVLGEHFWHAFQQQMASDAGAPLWTAFLEQNEQAIATISQEAVVENLAEQHRTQKIISGEDLVAEMNKHYMRLQEENAGELDKAEKSVLKQARAAAQAMIDDSPLAHISRLQTTALTTHLTIENGLRELHSVNFLSKNLGAVINRPLSSPTARRPWKGLLHKTYTWWQGIQPFPHGPDMALDRWTDVSDAWCAPPSTAQGSAQLAVVLGHVVVPHTFTIEHMPRAGTLNIAAAPRDFAVWAEAASPAAAAELEAVVAPQRGPVAACAAPPGPAFVCLAAGTYDIHAANWVQEFPLHARSPDFDVPVKSLVFRALNNWGGDYTCIYRIRMTGERLV